MTAHREIERKYLVTGEAFREEAVASSRVTQGYLCSDPRRTVRVRIKDDRGYLTIKGESTADGLSRLEWEREIPLADAEQLLRLCEPGVIDKTRHLVPLGPHVVEVDVFHGDNDGLVLAEIELRSESDTPPLPSWLGREVTGDPRYYNAYLSRHPYRTWQRSLPDDIPSTPTTPPTPPQ